MPKRTAPSWFYPKLTGDVGKDRNARTLQTGCLLGAFALSVVAVLNLIAGVSGETPLLAITAAGLGASAVVNRAGFWRAASRVAMFSVLFATILLVVEARDGFRSHAMLLFPGLLLLSVMLLDRAFYFVAAGVVLLAVTALGIAEMHGLIGKVPPVRTPTSYAAILSVDLNLLALATIGSLIARDTEKNVLDLRASNGRLSAANAELNESADALRESEERFRNVADTAPVLIWVSGPDKLCTFFNKPWLEFTGRTMEQEIGNGWADGVHPDDFDRCFAIYSSSFDARRSFQMQYRLRRADDEYRWVLDNGTPRYREGEFAGYIGSCIDITERKLMEERLRSSEALLTEAERLAKVGSWERQIGTGEIRWSAETHRIFGLTSDAPTGLTAFVNCVHPEDREKILEVERQVRSAYAPVETEYRIIRPDGEVRFIRSVVEAIRNHEGDPTRLVGATQDITDVRRAQQQDISRQKLESLGVLAGGVAHDFNNLLGGIVTNAELVLSELPDGSPASEGIESIRNVAYRAAEIVGAMMTYAGQEDTVFEPVDLSELLHEMFEFLKVSISKRATMNVALPEKLPSVRANAAQLRQVVLNLITNASEALGEQEGVISIAATQVQCGPSDSVPNLSRGDCVRLEVSDTGCGMTEEVQSKIFDPFFTTKFPGRGMGLAAVKGIIRSHGGTINFVSAPGQGSRFEILLPCSSESPRERRDEAVPSAAGEIASFTGTILLVEDEDTLRLAVSKMLGRKGFAVIEAANGQTGVDLFQAHAPEIDIVLLDLTLPGLSGREVLSELRRIKPDVKVIVTSAYSQERARTTLGGQRPWLYIRKPYQLNELTGLLRKSILETRRVSDQANG